MEKILLPFGLPQQKLLQFFKNIKAIFRSSDGDTVFLCIFAEVLQGDTYAPYLFIICRDYKHWTSIDLIKVNGFTLERTINCWNPVETIIDTDYTDDIAVLVNTIIQAASLLQSLQVNANKADPMSFKQ